MPLAAFSRLAVLNVRELRTHWGRALASIAVVAVSAALLVAVLGVSGSITGSIDRLATSIGGDANLEVSGITGDGIDEGMLDTVGKVENVRAAVPLVRTRVTADSRPALLIGLGQNAAELHSDLQTAIQDQLQSGTPVTSAPNGVIVGGGLGVSKGQQLQVAGTTVTAVAVVDGPAARRLNDAHFVIAPLALAQRISGRDRRLDSILVFTDPRADVGRVREAVTAALDGRAVVSTPSFRAAQASSSFAILQAMTLLAASVSLVVAAFLSYNAMSIAIAQRRPIISTMRALGGRRRTIMSDMLGEAAVVGLLGGLIGSAVGVVIGQLAIGRLPSTMVQTLDARLEYVLSPWVVPLAVTACIVASVAASALAARQVHAVAPIEAMAPSGSAVAEAGSPRLRIVAGIAGVALLGRHRPRRHQRPRPTGDRVDRAVVHRFQRAVLRPVRTHHRGRCGGGALLRGGGRARRGHHRARSRAHVGGDDDRADGGRHHRRGDRRDEQCRRLDGRVVRLDRQGRRVGEFGGRHRLFVRAAAAGTADAVAAVPGVERVVPDQMAFATVGDTRVMLLGIAADSHRDIYASLSPRDRQELLAGEGVALSRDLGQVDGTSLRVNRSRCRRPPVRTRCACWRSFPTSPG